MKNRLTEFAKVVSELGKVRITFAVSLTTALGYLIYLPAFTYGMLFTVIGLFLLACGSAALNQYQEWDKDALMDRTKNRPIPSGRISPEGGLTIAFNFIMLGSAILYAYAGFVALQLGILTLLWYNAIYTPLKKKTAFAVIPGSVIGALPPMVGWSAAGGSITEYPILFLGFFMFIWQIPHFWLLMLKYGNQYTKAGFPAISSVYETPMLKRITFVWITATAVSGLFFPFFSISNNLIISVILTVSSFMLIAGAIPLIRKSETEFNTRKHFMYINIYLLVIIIALSVDSFL